jgi:hypothetical protein
MTRVPNRKTFLEEAIAPEDRMRIAALPNAQRQQRFADMLVRHDGFDEIVKFLDLAHMPVPDGHPNVGRITAVYAPFRSGKSTAIKYYCARFPEILDGTAVKRRVLYFHCHGNMTPVDIQKGLFGAVTGLVAPDKDSGQLAERLIDQIAARGVEMVILDDLHTTMLGKRSDSVRRIKAFLIKLLEAGVCHVTVAGPEELDAILAFDDLADDDESGQLEGRGGLINAKIPRYDWHDAESRKRYRILLDRIDDRLPFEEKSGLGATQVAAHFYDMFGDSIGNVLDLLYYAMGFAIRDRAKRIRIDDLARVAALRRRRKDPFVHFVEEMPLELVGRRKGENR